MKIKQRGQALTGVIILVSLLSWFTLQKISSVSADRDNIQTIKNTFKADDLCESGIAVAEKVLRSAADQKMSLDSVWRRPLRLLPLSLPKGSMLDVSVVDEESKLNIRKCSQAEIKALLNTLESKSGETKAAVSAAQALYTIMDFLEKIKYINDFNSTKEGGKMLSSFKGLSDNITVFGDNLININTASPELILAVLSCINRKNADSFVKKIVSKRPFSSTDDIIRLFPKHYTKQNRQDLLARFSVKSTFFTIHSSARVMNARKNIENIIRLSKSGKNYEFESIQMKKIFWNI
jgi:type II secretory pathway component PulK